MATDTTKADATHAMLPKPAKATQPTVLPESLTRALLNLVKAIDAVHAVVMTLTKPAAAKPNGHAKPTAQRKTMVVIKAEPEPKVGRQKPAKGDGVAGKGNGKVAKAKASEPTSKPRKAGNGASKTQVIGELLRRKEGCTAHEALAAIGWTAISMPQQAKHLGLQLRMVKNPGELTRYFAV